MQAFRVVGRILRETVEEFSSDNAAVHGAALAFYALFSFAPLIVLATGIATLVVDEAMVRRGLVALLGHLLTDEGVAVVERLARGVHRPSPGIWATLGGLLALLVAATSGVAQLQLALNEIWGVQPRPGRLVRTVLKQRAVAFLVVVLVGAGILATAVANVLVATVLGQDAPLLGRAEDLVAFSMLFVLLAVTYKILPDAQVVWRVVWLGAAITAVLVLLGRGVVSWYFTHVGTTSVPGATGALVAFALYVYYVAQLLLLGAEFTQVQARLLGWPIRPAPHAVPTGRALVAHHKVTCPDE